MVKEQEASAGSARPAFQLGIYKRSQGRIARQATFAALAVVLGLGMYFLTQTLRDVSFPESLREVRTFLVYGIPVVLLIVGLFVIYRIVNMPRFADFLIGVEAEMNKVSWPTQTELVRSTIVVMFTIFFLVAILFAYDLFWRTLLQFLGVRA